MTKPAYLKTIVCLAASRKHSGRCIAGKVLDGDEVGTWIRPVSKRPSGELSALDCRYQNAVSAALFDIIELPIIGSASHSFQIENHFNDDKFWWKKKGEASWKQIGNLVDKFTGPIWENGSSSYNGRSDRVPEDRAAQAVIDFGSSLTLIDVGDLEIIVQIEGAAFNNPSRHVRGHFTYSGNQYRMMITDPNIEAEFFAKTDGTYRIGRALLCLSLGNRTEASHTNLSRPFTGPETDERRFFFTKRPARLEIVRFHEKPKPGNLHDWTLYKFL